MLTFSRNLATASELCADRFGLGVLFQVSGFRLGESLDKATGSIS